MHRAFVYRLYPTAAQATEMQRQLDVARELYNAWPVDGIIKTVTIKRACGNR